MAMRRMLVIAALIGAPATMSSQSMRLPAEWEPHERVWLTWFGQGRRDSVSAEMVKALQPHVKLTMNVASAFTKENAIRFLAAHDVGTDSIEFAIDPNIDYFVPDYAVFVKDESDKVHVVDFCLHAVRLVSPTGRTAAAGEREAVVGTTVGETAGRSTDNE